MDAWFGALILVLIIAYMQTETENFSFWGNRGIVGPDVINYWDVRRFYPSNPNYGYGSFNNYASSYTFPRGYRPYSGFGGIWNQLANPHRGRGRALFGGRRL